MRGQPHLTEVDCQINFCQTEMLENFLNCGCSGESHSQITMFWLGRGGGFLYHLACVDGRMCSLFFWFSPLAEKKMSMASLEDLELTWIWKVSLKS